MSAPIGRGRVLNRLGLGGAIAPKLRFVGVAAFQAALILLFTATTDEFWSFSNGRSILFSAAIVMIAAAGQTLVVLTGNLDLSVGSIMGLTAYIMFDLTGEHSGLGPFVIIVAVAVGAALGLVNGFLVAVLEIPSIVATLGTMSIYRGLVSFYADGKEVNTGSIPGYMRDLAMAQWFGVSAYVWLAIATVALTAGMLRHLPFGRSIFALGSNPRAARYYGLRSHRVIMSTYVLAGAIAGFAGLLLGARVGNINSLLASNIELEVLAAVVIGGTSIWGGTGSVWSSAFGAIVLATINNGLVLWEVQEYYRLLIQGSAIIAAVGVDALVRHSVMAAIARRRAVGGAAVRSDAPPVPAGVAP